MLAETTAEIPTVAIIAILTTSHWSACGLAVLLSILLIYLLRQSLGTTLFAPCVWALVSTASLALNALVESQYGSSEQSIGLSALRFAAVAGSLCPLMAVLGAKRPQNHGWQWVVLTLWLVIVWPAAQAVLIPTGLSIELFIVWKLFLVGLIGVGLLNYLPTKNWPSACLVAAGQAVLLDNFLWSWGLVNPEWISAVGLSCFLAAAILVGIRKPKKQSRDGAEIPLRLAEFNRRWLDFRDAFGALWALRILARLNQTAEVSHWPMRLDWAGFVFSEDAAAKEPTAKQLNELEQAMSTLLRRFV